MVLYSLDAEFVVIGDGATRKLDHLKKKRRKHLTACPWEFPELVEKYQAGRLLDSDIRKVLFPIANQEGGVTTPEDNREG